MLRIALRLLAAGCFVTLVACGAAPPATPLACAALAGFAIPAAAIGSPSGGAVVTSAAEATAGPATFCKLQGAIAAVHAGSPDIHFQLNLPAAWNGKAIHYGGGGYDGSVVTADTPIKFATGVPPLERGFATFGSDSGHAGSVADGSFALDAQALADFAGDQLKKTHDVALMKARYGSGPKRMYVIGSSQGGHEALIAIQRWPQDYDGASVTHPVYDFVALQLSGNRAAKAMYAPGAWVSPAKLAFLDAKVREVCDGLDGVVDGLVSNVAACDAAFKIEAYRCVGGTDTGDTCFSDAQIAALNTMNSRSVFGFKMQAGVDSFARWPIFEGAALEGLFAGGKSATPHKPPKAFDDFGLYVLADPAIRYFFAQNANADSLAFDPSAYRDRIVSVSQQVDANRVTLEAFEARGGKMLLVHGTSDFAVSEHNTRDYYQRLVEHFGQDRLDRFTRFYLVPGFGHGGGRFDMSWDLLGTLDAWVEQGTAPASLVTTDNAAATRGRTRPLCVYPGWPKYVSGDVNVASSFTCSR